MAWATDTNNNKIFWLSGMAGTGKTTIAFTLSETLDKEMMLGATFFCSRLEEATRNTRLIFPTIAYELARKFPSVSRALVDVLKRDSDAAVRSLQLQFVVVTPITRTSESDGLF